MGKDGAFDDDDSDDGVQDVAPESFDAEEDALPTMQIVQRHYVERPVAVTVEATTGEENTFIKFFKTLDPSSSKYCFVDTVDPSSILNILVEKFESGLYEEVADFFDEYGRVITDPVKFRLRLDAIARPARPGGAVTQ